ncbi:MAG: hypothetical protein WCK55_12175 [Verrucomicrobiota bacterium]
MSSKFSPPQAHSECERPHDIAKPLRGAELGTWNLELVTWKGR